MWQRSVEYLAALVGFCGDLGGSVMVHGTFVPLTQKNTDRITRMPANGRATRCARRGVSLPSAA